MYCSFSGSTCVQFFRGSSSPAVVVVFCWLSCPVQALPLFASEKGASVQELSLEDVIPAIANSAVLSDGKLRFLVVTVPETATIEVYQRICQMPCMPYAGTRQACRK